MYDAQRLHLKRLEDAERDNYQQKIRDMTTAALATNSQVCAQKQSSEAYWKAYEAKTDQHDLLKMNQTALNPSATMTQGTKF